MVSNFQPASSRDEGGKPQNLEQNDATEVFHWVMILLLVWSTVGTHIDARNHAHHGFGIESFLVPSHYALYSAWLLMAVVLLAYVVRNILAGDADFPWLPVGYDVTALGVVFYFLGGIFDMFWHAQFGFEVDLEVTLSPSHLILWAAAIITTGGVVRHELYRRRTAPDRDSTSFFASFALILLISMLLVRVMWPTLYFDPLAVDYASGGAVVGHLEPYQDLDFDSLTGQVAGVAGALLVTMILVVFIITPLYRWRLPVGFVTFMLAYHAVLRAYAVDTYVYVPAIIGAGVIADGVWAWTRGGGETRMESTLPNIYLAFLTPVALLTAYFSTMAILPIGIVWPVHLWGGVIWLSGMIGAIFGFALTGRNTVS